MFLQSIERKLILYTPAFEIFLCFLSIWLYIYNGFGNGCDYLNIIIKLLSFFLNTYCRFLQIISENCFDICQHGKQKQTHIPILKIYTTTKDRIFPWKQNKKIFLRNCVDEKVISQCSPKLVKHHTRFSSFMPMDFWNMK